jgi:uncharacterized protein (TIGR00645 family)
MLENQAAFLYNRRNHKWQRSRILKTILEKSRYFALIGIIPLLVASLAAFAWGLMQTIRVVVLEFVSLGTDKALILGFLLIVDIFLIATTLLIFSISLYELFIGEIDAPEWMTAHSLNDLKGKLGSMMVLVMAIKFLEILMQGGDAQDIMWTALAVSLVSGVLIAFTYFGKKE